MKKITAGLIAASVLLSAMGSSPALADHRHYGHHHHHGDAVAIGIFAGITAATLVTFSIHAADHHRYRMNVLHAVTEDVAHYYESGKIDGVLKAALKVAMPQAREKAEAEGVDLSDMSDAEIQSLMIDAFLTSAEAELAKEVE